MSNIRFEKHNLILRDNRNYQCICADDEVAVFGEFRTVHEKEGTVNSVDYENIFAVANNLSDDGFEYELIDG